MKKWFELFGKIYPYVDPISEGEARESASKGELVIVDISDDGEVARFGLCEGALHIPLPMIRHAANRTSPHYEPALDPGKSFALYGRKTDKALMAAQIMKKLGYPDVYVMANYRGV